jgi:hypothetical protein
MPNRTDRSKTKVGHDPVKQYSEQLLIAQSIGLTASGLDQPFRSNDHR